MTRLARLRLGIAVLLLGAVVLPGPARATDVPDVFKKGGYVLSLEGGYGEQFNLEGRSTPSDMRFWNLGARGSLLPFEPVSSGPLRGAFEIGLQPMYQRYVDPQSAFWLGLGAVLRYHFLALGRLVPYAELSAAAGGTDLRVREIDSNFAFLLFGGVGTSFFLTDTLAVYAGYRFQHISNGNTDEPNRGFESHWGVVGFSHYFR